jgi:hypothetical protein
MRRQFTWASAVLAVLAAGSILGGCLGRTSTVTLDEETATLEFGVVAVRLEAGDGMIVDFCVVLNDSACGFPGGEVLGCELDVPASQVRVFCADPILAQWPDTWTLLSATWSAPSVPASGMLLVEPAAGYLLPAGSNIITDPGQSTYVMRLDLDADFGPADVDVSLVFDHGNDTAVVVKAVEVLVAELQSPGSEKVLIPLGNPNIDFPNLSPENGLDVGATVAVEHPTWSRLKKLFKR